MRKLSVPNLAVLVLMITMSLVGCSKNEAASTGGSPSDSLDCGVNKKLECGGYDAQPPV